jgi:hypothetical protein
MMFGTTNWLRELAGNKKANPEIGLFAWFYWCARDDESGHWMESIPLN